jgi:hypothetical protein
MNQFVLFHFTIDKNNRIYQFVVQPGAPWEDIEAVVEEFKIKMLDLKVEAQKPKEEITGEVVTKN